MNLTPLFLYVLSLCFSAGIGMDCDVRNDMYFHNYARLTPSEGTRQDCRVASRHAVLIGHYIVGHWNSSFSSLQQVDVVKSVGGWRHSMSYATSRNELT